MENKIELLHGDCLEKLKALADSSIDAIVTDPPYELGFMGKSWDKSGIAYNVDLWCECFRVLKPGAHLLAFSGSRTYHRMACAIEDAGFEIRDMVEWIYGSGFPKSLDISKAIDKAAGVERTEVVGIRHRNVKPFDDSQGWNSNNTTGDFEYTAPATDSAKQWKGWGTALKPSHEPICLARKPLGEKNVAANVLKHGTGGLNIDGCRVEMEDRDRESYIEKRKSFASVEGKIVNSWKNCSPRESPEKEINRSKLGRWPANLILSDEEEVTECFPVARSSFGGGNSTGKLGGKGGIWGNTKLGHDGSQNQYYDSGSAARFFKQVPIDDETAEVKRLFYCAKASKAERGENNNHPTVKPLNLMRYLCKLVTPPNGIILDPFMGSGSTGLAAISLNFAFIGIEKELASYEIAQTRIANVIATEQLEIKL